MNLYLFIGAVTEFQDFDHGYETTSSFTTNAQKTKEPVAFSNENSKCDSSVIIVSI